MPNIPQSYDPDSWSQRQRESSLLHPGGQISPLRFWSDLTASEAIAVTPDPDIAYTTGRQQYPIRINKIHRRGALVDQIYLRHGQSRMIRLSDDYDLEIATDPLTVLQTTELENPWQGDQEEEVSLICNICNANLGTVLHRLPHQKHNQGSLIISPIPTSNGTPYTPEHWARWQRENA